MLSQAKPGVMGRIRQAYCGLRGHDALLQFERDRMYLRCVSCGHQSPGWELNETSPVATVRPEASLEPQTVAPAHLISVRRVA